MRVCRQSSAWPGPKLTGADRVKTVSMVISHEFVEARRRPASHGILSDGIVRTGWSGRFS